jgi:hypothetical protein
MLNLRLSAAREVADQLFALEAAIDAALISASTLTAALPQARNKLKISAVIGQDAINKVAKGLSALVDARQAVVEAHHHLAETKDKLGLREYSMGGLQKLSITTPRVADDYNDNTLAA